MKILQITGIKVPLERTLNFSPDLEKSLGGVGGEITQYVVVLAMEADNLSSLPRIHIV